MKKKQRRNKKKKRGFRSFLGLFASGVVVDSGASRLQEVAVSTQSTEEKTEKKRLLTN